MTEDAGTRWIALASATSLHIALGLALLSAASGGVPSRGKPLSQAGHTTAVTLVPDVQPATAAAANVASTHRDTDAIAVQEQRDHGSAEFVPSRTIGTGSMSKTAAPAAVASTMGQVFADLPDAELLAYRARLQAHLARYRVYPPAAQGAREQGVVELRVMIDRQGQVIDAWVSSSSGAGSIDNEAVAAVLRAQPLPGFPAGWPDRLDVELPVRFRLE